MNDSPRGSDGIGPSRPAEPAWRFWAKELLYFSINLARGRRRRLRRRLRLGPDALVALTPEERELLQSWDAVRGWERKDQPFGNPR